MFKTFYILIKIFLKKGFGIRQVNKILLTLEVGGVGGGVLLRPDIFALVDILENLI